MVDLYCFWLVLFGGRGEGKGKGKGEGEGKGKGEVFCLHDVGIMVVGTVLVLFCVGGGGFGRTL